MSYTPIKLPNPPLSFVDGESLALDLQTAATGAGGTQVGKTLNFTAYISFLIPSALAGDYAAASQDKKEVMARIYFQVMAEPATDFDTQYTAIYSALYP